MFKKESRHKTKQRQTKRIELSASSRCAVLSAAVAAVAVLCTTACSDSRDPMPRSTTQHTILFDEPILATATKSGSTPTYPKTENFTVYAISHTEAFTQWPSGAPASWPSGTELYMDCVECAYNLHARGWDPALGTSPNSRLYLWPNGRKLTFQAFSPTAWATASGLSGAVGAHIDHTGVNCTKYQVPSKAKNAADTEYPDYTDNIHIVPSATPNAEWQVLLQPDLMYSNRCKDQERITATHYYEEGGKGASQLVFNHALSSIQFNVRLSQEYAGVTFRLTGIELHNVRTVGDFAQNLLATELTNVASQPAWSCPDGNLCNYMNILPMDMTVESATATPVTTTPLFILPQPFGTTTFKIDYTVQMGNGTAIPMYATIPLSALYYTTGSDPSQDAAAEGGFKVGRQYTYTIVIEKTKIRFDAVMTDNSWTILSN